MRRIPAAGRGIRGRRNGIRRPQRSGPSCDSLRLSDAEMPARLPAGTAYTYDFVKSAIPFAGARLLEVGCGDGRLAAWLAEDGFSVVALDEDESLCATARARGVDARAARWPIAIEE